MRRFNQLLADAPIDAGFRFSKFVIIESLEDQEVKTGKILAETLNFLVAEHAPYLVVEYLICGSANEFRQRIQDLVREAKEQDHAPVLHIECHGSRSAGLEFSNGSLLSWPDLAAELTELNVATHFNLLAVLSACFGGYLLGELTPLVPAACWCVVAPTDAVDPAESMQGLRNFYATLLTHGDAGKAAAALRSSRLSKGEWFAQLAQLWFERLVLSYVESHCKKSAMRVRAQRTYQQAKVHGIEKSIGEFRRLLKLENRRILTGKSFDVFFCVDRLPNVRTRFAQVTSRLEQRLATIRSTGRYDI